MLDLDKTNKPVDATHYSEPKPERGQLACWYKKSPLGTWLVYIGGQWTPNINPPELVEDV